MIEKMRFVSITGPLQDLDKTVMSYLTNYEIHLENALSELQNTNNLRPILTANPYQKTVSTLNDMLEYIDTTGLTPSEVTIEDAMHIASDMEAQMNEHKNTLAEMDAELKKLSQQLDLLSPYEGLDMDIKKVTSLKFVKYRFGRVGVEYFRKFQEVIENESHAIFVPSTQTLDYIYGVYFVPLSEFKKLDAQLYSLHFERFHIPDDEEGTPSQICEGLRARIRELEAKREACDHEIKNILAKDAQDIYSASVHINQMSKCYEVRKKAACTKDKDGNSFILCGWMPGNQADLLEKELNADPTLSIITDDGHVSTSKPPTRFKNPRLFKPFEMYTEMYGLPAYNEMDPTIFIGITYSFIFGWMFGDVGQGLCLAVLGLLLYKLKSIKLAGIISLAGVFSTFFGFMFGSIFGFEDLIPAYWLRPKEAMSALPFVGNLNTVFAVAIVFGMGMILVTMIINIVNSLRVHDLENGLFSQNGIAGLVFYGVLVATILMFMTDHMILGGIVIGLLLGLPVVAMALKEPLTHLLTHKKEESQTGIGMFIAQTFFELFEIMLSYFSNTLSFVRIGAFAISHAAMMEVVMMLAGAEAGSPNWIVVVLGNIFIMGMEGLVVGIQVLRLEYYEFFSRFYRGTGRPFVSLKDTLNIKH